MFAFVVILATLLAPRAISQQLCGLDELAAMAEQSVFLESCQPDLGCSMIRCNIGDETTLLFVQIAQLTVLPCSLPVPQVEFQLLDEGTSRFMYMVNSTGQVIINLPGLSLGTLSSFVNHSSNSIGIMMEFTPSGGIPMTLFNYTDVPLDFSSCPITDLPGITITTRDDTTVGSQTTLAVMNTTPSCGAMQFSSLFLVLLTSLTIFLLQ